MKGHVSVLRSVFTAVAFLALGAQAFAQNHDEFYVPAVGPVVLRFAAIDPARGAIDQHWLLNEIAAALQARTSLPLSALGKTTAELSGLRTHLEEDQAQIVFEYVHLAQSKGGEEWGETLTIPVSYRVQRSDVLFLVRLEPARVADLSRRRTPGLSFLSAPKLGPIAPLIDDFTAVLGSAESLELRRAFLLLGQMDTALPPRICMDRLDFELGRYAYGKDEEHTFDPKFDDVFLFRTVRESVPLKVIAVNDRGGSRVFYEARLPFELHADGTVKGYDLADAVRYEVNRVLQDAPTREARDSIEGIHSDVIISERR